MSQKAEISIDYETLVKIIKEYLVQDENAQAPNTYVIEYSIDGYENVCISVIEEIMIGGVKGKLKEELEDYTIEEMITDYIKAEDYTFDSFDYIVETDGDGKKILSGIIVALEPDFEKSFVKEL